MHRDRHLLLAILGGLLMTLAWPGTGGVSSLLFIGPVPFLLIIAERSDGPPSVWRRGVWWRLFIGLAIWNLATTTWLGNVQEGQATRTLTGIGVQLANAGLMLIPLALGRSVRRTFGVAWGWAATVIFWIAFEWAHMNWDLQWPWLTLGNGWAGKPDWVQWYEVTGHLGGTLWVWLCSLSILRVVIIWKRSVGTRSMPRAAIGSASIIILPICASLWRGAHYEPRGTPMEVVVVQPNIDPYSEKFGGVDPLEQLERMLGQADPLITQATALVVFPETALQESSTLHVDAGGELFTKGLWENDLKASRSVQRLLAWQLEHPGVAVLAGMSSAYLFPPGAPLSVTARPVRGADRWFDASNAALWLDGQGAIEHYRKSKLVAGVELLPFQGILGSLDFLAIDLGGTSGSLAGQSEREVFRDGARALSVAPVICYESVFADHVAEHVRNGANLIAIITNDGWWGDTPGYKQHLAYASLRAIECRRDIARSANTGISCFIDQRGHASGSTPWWRPAAIRGTVLLNTEETFYVRHGDLLGRGALALSALVLGFLLVQWAVRLMRRPRHNGPDHKK